MSRRSRPETDTLAALRCLWCLRPYWTTPNESNECPYCGERDWIVCGRDHHPKKFEDTSAGNSAEAL